VTYKYLLAVARPLQQLPALQQNILNPIPSANASHRKQKKRKRRSKMKNTPYFELHRSRYQSEARAARGLRGSPQTEPGYQSAKLLGGCGTPAKFHRPAFFELSNRYFASEEPRGIAIDTAVFVALIGSALLPIVNSVQAVAALLHGLPVI
jgi:hypothetical protein